MTLWESVRRHNFLIKLRSREYWPFGIIHFPAILYWLWLSFRSRSPVFFTASNPGIPMGGMFGESKFDVLSMIPPHLVPVTIRMQHGFSVSAVEAQMKANGLRLPVIFKPDIGERGYMVRQIDNSDQMEAYLREVRCDFLIQERVALPLEYGVFFMKIPGQEAGRVISLVAKEMLSVTGDGRSTLRELILRKDRAKLQWKKLRVDYRDRLNEVIPSGETTQLVAIGNHALGTRFINANHLITDGLSKTFDTISKNISGFYFGRYDLRCATTGDLHAGNVKVMELNGCGAEPGHIYDSSLSLWAAIKAPVVYWHYIFMIAQANNARGVRYLSFREALAHYRKFRTAMR